MTYAIAMYSGLFWFIYYPTFWHVKNGLGKDATQYTVFNSVIRSPWVITVIFGAIIDSIFPFNYK